MFELGTQPMTSVCVVSRRNPRGEPCFVVRVTVATDAYDSGHDCGHLHRSEHAALRCLRAAVRRLDAASRAARGPRP